MRTRTKVFLLVCSLATMAALTVILGRSGEPRYQGRPLSHWVAMFDGNHQEEDINQAKEAVTSIGTNALPLLLKWIQFERGAHPFRSKLASAIEPHISSYSQYVLIHGRRDLLARSVTEPFQVLGARATPAIPELTRLMNNPSAPDTAARATLALAHVGTNGLPALLTAIDSPGHACRYFALWAIPLIRGGLGAFEDKAVPPLIRCLSDQTDPKVAPAAATALASFKSMPLVVPALTHCLASTNGWLRRSATEALGDIGALAAPALPALTNALAHPDPKLRSAAKDAIFQISHAVLTNASPQ